MTATIFAYSLDETMSCWVNYTMLHAQCKKIPYPETCPPQKILSTLASLYTADLPCISSDTTLSDTPLSDT